MKKLSLKLASVFCALSLAVGPAPVSIAQTAADADNVAIVSEDVNTDADTETKTEDSDQQAVEDKKSSAKTEGQKADQQVENAGESKDDSAADVKSDDAKEEAGAAEEEEPSFKTMAAERIEFDIAAGPYPYTGKAITPSVTNVRAVYEDGTEKKLAVNEYKIYNVNSNVNAGKATVFLRGEGEFKNFVSDEKDFTITPADIRSAAVSLNPSSMTYTGGALAPKETVIWNGMTLHNGTDYSLQYYNNVNVGLATVAIYGKGNYTGSVNVNFSIARKDQSFTVTPNPAKVKLNKKAKLQASGSVGALTFTSSKPEVVAVNNSGTFKGKKTGSAVITVTAAGDANTNPATVRVTVKVSGAELSADTTKVTLSKTKYNYDGKAKKPSVTVKYKGKKLTRNKDYKLYYQDNVDAGKATVLVKGINKYSGQVKKRFRINQVDNTLKAVIRESSIDVDEKTKITVKKAIGEVTFKTSNKKIATVTQSGVVTGKREGTCTITVMADGDENHKASTKKFTVSVGTKDISDDDCDITLSRYSYPYDGNEKTPSVTVRMNGKTLRRYTDYSVTYYDNVSAGNARVVVKGRGEYTGSRIITFKIGKKEQTNFTISVPNNRIPLGGTVTVKVSGARGKLTYGSLSPSYAKPLGNGRYQGLQRTKNGVTITVTAAGDKTYEAKTKQLWVQVY